jgi:cytochrome c biogenesis protein CcmG, thiol:disulfide interchange protein DsbE
MKFSQPFRARLLYGIFLSLGLGWIWFSAIPIGLRSSESIPAPQAGFLAPDFTLKTLDGGSIKLSSLRGKVVLINIWASWCPPCRAEMPAIDRVYQTYKNDGFVVLAVDSTIQDTLANAQTFVQENNLGFPILLDENGSVTRLYQVNSLPSTFFIGSDGVIREVVIGGPMSEALLFSRVEKLIQEVP